MLKLFHRRHITVEIAFKHVVIADHDALDQVVVHLVLTVNHVFWHLPCLGAAGIVEIRLIPEEVGNTVEGFLLSDRELDRCNSRSEPVAQLCDGAFERGAFLVELVDEYHARRIESFCDTPCVLGLNFDAFDGIDNEDREVGNSESRVEFARVVRIFPGYRSG